MVKKAKRGKKAKKVNPMAKLLMEMSQNYSHPPSKAFDSVEDKWVKVQVRLMNWRALNFNLRVLESTNFHIIEQKIAERHGGSIQKIKLYHDTVAPNCEIFPKDFDQTLRHVFKFDEMGPYYVKKKNVESNVQPALMTDDEQQTINQENGLLYNKANELYNADGDLDYDYECVLYYDFSHFESDDPLLKTSPRLKEVLETDKKKKQHAVS